MLLEMYMNDLYYCNEKYCFNNFVHFTEPRVEFLLSMTGPFRDQSQISRIYEDPEDWVPQVQAGEGVMLHDIIYSRYVFGAL